LLRPCDLHVLTTPPAFRLSQDQTLQLFFLDHPSPDAPCETPHLHAGLRPRLTLSWGGLSSKKNLSTDRPQTKHPESSDRLLLPHRRLRRAGTVESPPTPWASPAAKRDSMQGSKHLLAVSGANRRRFLTQINDFPTKVNLRRKGSLSCVHREDVLRYRRRMLFDDIRFCPIDLLPKQAIIGLTSSR
jgi:hypothetical protein